MRASADAALLQAIETGGLFGPGPVERIDTHAAHVFLVGDRAYKIKRPVALSVLDFRSPASRKRALDAELQLNQRTAPELYLRVITITREGTAFSVTGQGAPVEWALEMRRFPRAAQLDHMARQAPLSAKLAAELGAAIARFHEAAEPRRDMGGAAAMTTIIDGNRADFEMVRPGLFDADTVTEVDTACRTTLATVRPLLEARRAAGFVRFCHGDLHLANIVALGRGVTPFDCVEFSEEIACIDTIYDIAFLLMDLLAYEQRPAAWQVLDAYAEASLDVPGLRLLPFFMTLRASIRAKVTALTIDDPSAATADVARARTYLQLARRLLPARAPRLIAIGGFSGTGKTTLARALAPSLDPAPGALLLRSDVERKRLAGVAPTTHLGASAYTPDHSRACFAELRRRANVALRAGVSVVVDAVHDRAEDRQALEAVASATGAPFDGLWLEAGLDRRTARVSARRGDASDATAAVVRRQLDVDPGPIRWHRVDADTTPEATTDQARQALRI